MAAGEKNNNEELGENWKTAKKERGNYIKNCIKTGNRPFHMPHNDEIWTKKCLCKKFKITYPRYKNRIIASNFAVQLKVYRIYFLWDILVENKQ